jgi:hypothetical protein
MATPVTSLSTAAAATATSIGAAVAAIATNDAAPGNNGNGDCKLVGPFAIFVQGALGALALLVLVYKRWKERPQRPVKIWAFDVSKQVTGSVLLHLLNLLMSIFSSGQAERSMKDGEKKAENPCSFYLLNLAIDVSTAPPCDTDYTNRKSRQHSESPSSSFYSEYSLSSLSVHPSPILPSPFKPETTAAHPESRGGSSNP